jgi:hypothetical protein
VRLVQFKNAASPISVACGRLTEVRLVFSVISENGP